MSGPKEDLDAAANLEKLSAELEEARKTVKKVWDNTFARLSGDALRYQWVLRLEDTKHEKHNYINWVNETDAEGQYWLPAVGHNPPDLAWEHIWKKFPHLSRVNTAVMESHQTDRPGATDCMRAISNSRSSLAALDQMTNEDMDRLITIPRVLAREYRILTQLSEACQDGVKATNEMMNGVNAEWGKTDGWASPGSEAYKIDVHRQHVQLSALHHLSDQTSTAVLTVNKKCADVMAGFLQIYINGLDATKDWYDRVMSVTDLKNWQTWLNAAANHLHDLEKTSKTQRQDMIKGLAEDAFTQDIMNKPERWISEWPAPPSAWPSSWQPKR